jgi:hypothetical protein
MNTFSVLSRVLVVTAVVMGGSISASQEDERSRTTKNDEKITFFNRCASAGKAFNGDVKANKFTIAFATMSSLHCKKGEHAKRASLNMIGRQLDRIENGKELFILDVAYYGVGDYAIGIAGDKLNEYGVSVDAAMKQCDRLPDSFYIRDGVKFLVESSGNIITQPQLILHLLSYISSGIMSQFGCSEVS